MLIRLIKKRWWYFLKGNNNASIKPQIFSDIETWEKEYLIKKIQNKYSNIPEESIRNAVQSCYEVFNTPQSGEKLLQCVLSKLQANDTLSVVDLQQLERNFYK